MNKTTYIAFLFLILFLLQILICNNILFLGYINPYIYIAFVFLHPLNKNRFPFLILAFLMGLLIDVFSNSGGIHAFSTVFIAYIRLFFIGSIFKKTSPDYLLFKLNNQPFGEVFNYVLILTVIHHFIVFFLGNFSLQNFNYVLLNTIFSSIFTVFLFFIGNFIFSIKKQS